MTFSSDQELREKGYRLTPSRALILRLLKQTEAHLTLQELYEQVNALAPGISLSTLYRTLNLLTELGLIQEQTFPGQASTYEATTQAHSHVICRQCQKIIHIPEPELHEMSQLIQERYGFSALAFQLTVTGICGACSQS